MPPPLPTLQDFVWRKCTMQTGKRISPLSRFSALSAVVPAQAGTTAESQCRSPDGAKRHPGALPLGNAVPHFVAAQCGLRRYGASALDIRHQPFAECGERGIILPKRTIDEIPGLPLGHREPERRDQPARGEIVLDI